MSVDRLIRQAQDLLEADEWYQTSRGTEQREAKEEVKAIVLQILRTDLQLLEHLGVDPEQMLAEVAPLRKLVRKVAAAEPRVREAPAPQQNHPPKARYYRDPYRPPARYRPSPPGSYRPFDQGRGW